MFITVDVHSQRFTDGEKFHRIIIVGLLRNAGNARLTRCWDWRTVYFYYVED